MSRGLLEQRRLFLGADGHGTVAAIAELAARRQFEQVGDGAGDDVEVPVARRPPPDPGNRIHEAHRVGVKRGGENPFHGALLDDPARVHDGRSLGGLGDDPEIVRDQDHRRAHLTLQALDELEDLGLDRHVERRRGLVGQHEARPAGQGHGDHHPLPHPAAHLVGIIPGARLRGGYPDQPEHLHGPVMGFRGGEPLMEPQGLGDLIADAEHGVQGAHGLLEDHGDPLAPDAAHLLLRKGQEILSLEQDPARHDSAGRPRDQAHDGEGENCLAASRLAGDAEGVALVDAEIHAVDGLDGAPRRLEVRAQVFDLENRRHKR